MFSSRSWRPETGRGSISPAATRSASDASVASPSRIDAPEGPAPAGVARLAQRVEAPALEHLGRHQQGAGKRVDAADVGVEEVVAVDALAPQLGVEVEAAGREAAALEDLVDGERQLVDRVRELVGVPAVLVVAPVGVDAAEDAVRDGVGDLVVEAVSGQRGVVGLDVHEVLALEPVADEEAVDGGAVVVVLVLGRLLGLGLDEERALEADLVLVLGDQVQEPGELLPFAREVGVEERLVALAPAPERVVRAAQALGHTHHLAHLRRGVGEDLGIGVGRGAGRVARMAEEVGGAPEQAHTRAFLVRRGLVDDGLEVRARLGEGPALRRHVAVVEAVVRDAQLLEELEGGGQPGARAGHRVGGPDPGPVEGAQAEHVGACPGERVPQADADPEVLLHALAEHEPVRLVDLVAERVARAEPAESDRSLDSGEERLTHSGNLQTHALTLGPHGVLGPPVGSTIPVRARFVLEMHKPCAQARRAGLTTGARPG